MSAENNIIILCENIKALRIKNNLSKKEMAQKIGIGIKSLTAIESGILPRSVNATTLYKIHKEFGISIENLLESRIA